MDWLTGGTRGEANKWISQLADVTKRDQALRELIRMGEPAVLPLIDALQTQDLNLVLAYQHILARIPSASPHLIKTLRTAHPLVRGRVAEVFSISKDKNATPVLLEAIKGEFFTVRSRAALALSEIGDARVIHDLFPLLKDKDDEVRIAACIAIGKFRDLFTFDEITNVLLDDPKIEVRQSAAKVLGDTKHPAAIPFLMEALRDSFWWFEKEQSAQVLLTAIENMGSAVVEPLVEALGDREVTVRKYAAMVLGNLHDTRAIEELGMTVYDLNQDVSLAAAQALAKFGTPAVSLLSEALHHPEAAVREHAVIGLAKIQDARVAALLFEMLHDQDRIVQKQVILSVAELDDPHVVTALQEIANNRADREFSMLAKQLIETKK